MEDRDQRIYEEAAELWRELFGEPPPRRADGREMLKVITGSLAEVPYERLHSAHLRPSTILGPGQPRDEVWRG
jgi:hypothetical protein